MGGGGFVGCSRALAAKDAAEVEGGAEEGLPLEEIGEVETAAEDPALVDEEDGVSGEGGVARDVAAVEEGDEEWGPLEGGAGEAEGGFRV